jgi:phosphonatase-like hydrolase
MIELVVFDMAGTTVHDGDAVNACFRAALAATGVVADPGAVNRVMGLPKPEAIRRLLEGSALSASEGAIHAIHADFVDRMIRYYATDPAVREVPGAAATFARLRAAGVKVALNTGFSRAVLQAILARLAWSDGPAVIDASVASDEVPRGRPHPDMIRHLMQQLGVKETRKVAKVGDTLVDLEEGQAAGCGVVIGVTTGSYTREELQSGPHTHLLDSVVEVPGVVLGEVPRS